MARKNILNLNSLIYYFLIPILHMKVGIVGLPNVGKSTLFNALTKSYAAEGDISAPGLYPGRLLGAAYR